MLDYAVKANVPVVVATTGLNDEEKSYVAKASSKVPVFLSGNMSIGIASSAGKTWIHTAGKTNHAPPCHEKAEAGVPAGFVAGRF